MPIFTLSARVLLLLPDGLRWGDEPNWIVHGFAVQIRKSSFEYLKIIPNMDEDLEMVAPKGENVLQFEIS